MVAPSPSHVGLLPGVKDLSSDHLHDVRTFLAAVPWPGDIDSVWEELRTGRKRIWGGFHRTKIAEQLGCLAYFDIEKGDTAQVLLSAASTDMYGMPKDFDAVDHRRNQLEQLLRMGLGAASKKGREKVKIKTPAMNIALASMMQSLGLTGRDSRRVPGVTIFESTLTELRAKFRMRDERRQANATPPQRMSLALGVTPQPDARHPQVPAPSLQSCNTPQNANSTPEQLSLF